MQRDVVGIHQKINDQDGQDDLADGRYRKIREAAKVRPIGQANDGFGQQVGRRERQHESDQAKGDIGWPRGRGRNWPCEPGLQNLHDRDGGEGAEPGDISEKTDPAIHA